MSVISSSSLGPFNFEYPSELQLLHARHRRQSNPRPRRLTNGVDIEAALVAAEEAHARGSGPKLRIAQD